MVIISWTDWCDEVGVHTPPTNSKKDEKSDIKKLWNKTSKNIFGSKKQECPYYGRSEYNPTGGKLNPNSLPYPFYDESTCKGKSGGGNNKKLPYRAVVWKYKDNSGFNDVKQRESFPCLGYEDEGKMCRNNTIRKDSNKGSSIKKKKVIGSGPCSINANNSQSKSSGRKPTVRFLDNESTLKCDKPKGSELKISATNAKDFEVHRLKDTAGSTATKTTDTNNNNSENFVDGCKLDIRCKERAETFQNATTPISSNGSTLRIPSDSAFSDDESLFPKKKAFQDNGEQKQTTEKLIKRSDSCRQPPSSLGHHVRTVSKLLTSSNFRLAERKKHDGNECYKKKDYRDALKLYTEAIELCPDCAPYYSNRSACYMMLGKYAQALSDAREAVRLDSTFVKGYIRIVKCHVALGDANAALAVLRQASELDPGNKSIREEEVNAQALIKCVDDADKASLRKDYRMAIFHLDRALTLAAGCRSLKITKAEYLIFLHRYGDAQEIVNEILQFDSGNADAIYVRGMCLYYQNNHEAAFTHFQHVLRLAPDHKKAKDVYKKAKLLRQKKDEGNQAFNRGNLQDALRIYSEALAVDPNNVSTNSKLYCNRATVRAKLRNFEEAVEDVTAAINLEEGYIKAYLRRAKCYQELEKHEDAVRDYEKACKLDRNQENKRLLQEAKTLLKRSKWKDYYKILGVTKTASEDEIKKSYKKMALQHHPDRHASASDKIKHEHEVKFKEIGEAYTVLTDTKKKAMYDRGQDINDPDCGMFSHDDVDPNQIFQAFFGQGGSNAFGFGGGFPGASFSGSNSNNFPGGFHFQFS